jgi:hypothetical protein
MKKLLVASSTAIAVALATPAMADYTYLCRVGHKSYPVTLRIPHEDRDNNPTEGGSITWRGVTYSDLKQVEGCRESYTATNNGVTAELCTATQGYADLTIDRTRFYCQMPRSEIDRK